MKLLRFHKGLYSAEALSEAVIAFEPFASIAKTDQAEHTVVELTSREPDGDESTMAGEFSNYVLGGTVDRAMEGPGT